MRWWRVCGRVGLGVGWEVIWCMCRRVGRACARITVACAGAVRQASRRVLLLSLALLSAAADGGGPRKWRCARLVHVLFNLKVWLDLLGLGQA